MAESKTKYLANYGEIQQIFDKFYLPKLKEVEALGAGEFNAAFRIKDQFDKNYVIKISPKTGSKVLTYENNMMKSEVFWYEKIRENTDILIPEVYGSDFSNTIIPANYFIMECMPGKPAWQMGFSDEEYEVYQEQKIAMLTQIHRISSNHQFGYCQNGLKDTWYDAIKTMTTHLINDCEALGKTTPNGHKLLDAIEKHKDLLVSVEGCMVNFDLWDSNVLYHEGSLCWIDPERSFFGDPIADFITLGKGQFSPLSDKLDILVIYNKTAKSPISYDTNLEIRYQIAVAYLALIEEVEKYVRYEPDNEVYIRNTKDAETMYNMAFSIL